MAHEHEPGEEHEAGPRHELSHWAKRAYAMRDILIDKGVVTEEDIRQHAEFTESKTPANGARLVALAWTDPEFKARFVADPKKVCAEMGIDASTLNEFVVLENTDTVRHMVVCTLCSCYPRPILGRPPDWYKSFNYRKRAVNDPRGVMREFGLEVSDDVEVRVHDSTADMRYLVIPARPADTENLSVEELEKLVTRDSMIGVMDALAAVPG
ncbi:MAG: nitrile hydratase subunit alpha [Deltaproteobacteria bacterium]|nr:nitrile hydratase subunit alpha [Deltaproteobacteria bacterium]